MRLQDKESKSRQYTGPRDLKQHFLSIVSTLAIVAATASNPTDKGTHVKTLAFCMRADNHCKVSGFLTWKAWSKWAVDTASADKLSVRAARAASLTKAARSAPVNASLLSAKSCSRSKA